MAATRDRIGRPTQFHGVPIEERAVDAQGNRLPWALEWADDNPGARPQKRQQEDKGSFGKSTRRRGTLRATRTQTPAKKENPTLDGFEAALNFDAQNVSHDRPLLGVQVPTDPVHSSAPSVVNEPTQVMIYGYAPESQWAAIHYYESVSGGMICEDYEREAPDERRRYQLGLGCSGYTLPRTLTKAERALASQYKGGHCWIKVTMDSVEAANSAIYGSPHLIQGHWVYAKLYTGEKYDLDKPIPMMNDERQDGHLRGLQPSTRLVQPSNASFLTSMKPRSAGPARFSATSPRSNGTNTDGAGDSQQIDEGVSPSSSTVSSATAISPDQFEARPRTVSRSDSQRPTDITLTSTKQPPRTFTHFPDTTRTVLKPVTEAFLPQPSWSEKAFRRLTRSGWVSGDIIGFGVPRLENGDFDWSTASFYWKICYWVDTRFGMDLCGMKES
ncbi:hypothetical protein MMC26_004555 [Xylographa opegraphella]|nr:hypothetical protein [Xylographa opegraphella]